MIENNEAQERLMRNPETLKQLREAERRLAAGEFAILTARDLDVDVS